MLRGARNEEGARELIDFDKEWSAIMASPAKDPTNPGAGDADPAEVENLG